MSDAQSQLDKVLSETGPVLLDFDGPVCAVYPGDLNRQASQTLRQQLQESGAEVSPELARERDPLAVLRHAAQLDRPELAAALDKTLTAIEVEAVTTAPSTSGSAAFMRACNETRRAMVIVSNNAAECIHAYLDLHSLHGFVRAVIGRVHGDPALMKPHPHAVTQALEVVGQPPSECLLVGDSVTDIEVSHSIGLRSVAYVKAPDRWERLLAVQANAYVESMSHLASAVRARGRATTTGT